MANVMSLKTERPVTEVSDKAKRRRFSAKYKLRVLREAAACTKPGEVGALLRREGLYSSHLTSWRKQAERGELAGLTPRKRGPKPKPVDPRDKRIAQLERENRKLNRRAERAEALVEVQKKLSELLGIALPTLPDDEESK
jgi:transposase-like protein